jgi:type VI secretion system secreted protein Hcp
MYKGYCKIEGIVGESTDDAHENWIEVLSYSHGITLPSSSHTGGGGGAGKSAHEDFVIAKALDKASPKLVLACCNGEHIPEVVLELCHTGGERQKFMEYEMKDVVVASVRPCGNTNGEESRPVEEIAFRYGKIKFVYTIFDPQSGASAGYVQTHWDVLTNSGG